MRLHLRERWAEALASVLTLLLFGAWLGRLTYTGLSLEVFADDGRLLGSYAQADLGTSRTDAWLSSGVGSLRAVWTGYWIVPDPGFGEVVLKSDGDALVYLDGALVLSTGGEGPGQNRFKGSVAPGAHQLRVTYSPGDGTTHEVFLKGMTPDQRSISLERRATYSTRPSRQDVVLDTVATRVLPALVFLAWLFVLFGRRRSSSPRASRREAPWFLRVSP